MTTTRGPKELALDAGVERACVALERCDRERCWAALQALELSVGRELNDLGNALEYAVPRELFASQEAFFRDLAGRTPQAKTVALPLLASLDAPAAAPIFGQLLEGDFGFYAMSYEAGIARAVGGLWSTLAPLLPAGTLTRLFLLGKAAAHGLSDADLAAAPLDALVESLALGRLGYVHGDVPRRFLAVHPGLATDEGRLAFLNQLADRATRSHGEVRAFDGAIISALADSKYEAAVPTIARIWNAAAGEHLEATSALLAFGHRPSIETMMAKLPAALETADLRWDPHHVAIPTQTPFRAMFALDPATGTERFAPYLSAEALATDRGAKIAHDILSIGMGVAVQHGATVVGTGDRDWLDLDPRWIDVAVGLAAHPRLSKIAAVVLKRLPPKERKRRLAGGATAPGDGAPAKKPVRARRKKPSKA